MSNLELDKEEKLNEGGKKSGPNIVTSPISEYASSSVARVLNENNVNTKVIECLKNFLLNHQIFLDGKINFTDILKKSIFLCQNSKSEEILFELLSIDKLCTLPFFNSDHLKNILLSCSKFRSKKCFLKLLDMDGVKNNFSNWNNKCLDTAFYFISSLNDSEICCNALLGIKGIEDFTGWEKLNIFKTFSPDEKTYIILKKLWDFFGPYKSPVNINTLFMAFLENKRKNIFSEFLEKYPRAGTDYNKLKEIGKLIISERKINSNLYSIEKLNGRFSGYIDLEQLLRFLEMISNFKHIRKSEYKFFTSDKLKVLKNFSKGEINNENFKEGIIYFLNTSNVICGVQELKTEDKKYHTGFINNLFNKINYLKEEDSIIECLEALLRLKGLTDFSDWENIEIFKQKISKNGLNLILQRLSILMPVTNESFYNFYENSTKRITKTPHTEESKKEIINNPGGNKKIIGDIQNNTPPDNLNNNLVFSPPSSELVKQINLMEDEEEKKEFLSNFINSKEITSFTNWNKKLVLSFLGFYLDIESKKGLEKFLNLDGIKNILETSELLSFSSKYFKKRYSEKGKSNKSLEFLLSLDDVKNFSDWKIDIAISFLRVCKIFGKERYLKKFLLIDGVKNLLGGALFLNNILLICSELRSEKCINLVLNTNPVINFSDWDKLNIFKEEIPSIFLNLKSNNNGFNTFIIGKKQEQTNSKKNNKSKRIKKSKKKEEITNSILEEIIGKKVGKKSFKNLPTKIIKLEESEKESFLLEFLNHDKIKNLKGWKHGDLVIILKLCLKLKTEKGLLSILSINSFTYISSIEILNLILICCRDINSIKGLECLFKFKNIINTDFENKKLAHLTLLNGDIPDSWEDMEFVTASFKKFLKNHQKKMKKISHQNKNEEKKLTTPNFLG